MSASRFSAIRVLFLALVLALVASARAAEDHDDHDDHGEEELVDWACTANCPTDTGAAVRTHPNVAFLIVIRGSKAVCTSKAICEGSAMGRPRLQASMLGSTSYSHPSQSSLKVI